MSEIKDLKDLSKWIHNTGLFLSHFDKNKNNGVYKLIFNNFLYENGFQNKTNFYLWNQGTILILLYGLFVLPKEFWARFISDDHNNQADQSIFNNFEFNTRDCFDNCDNLDQKELGKEVFLRRLRNSIAHSRIDIIKGELGEIKFSNIDRDGNIDFSVKITPINLTSFLSEISKYFIDTLSIEQKSDIS
jgi:hypothetical protein